jgi:hypothetical protein
VEGGERGDDETGDFFLDDEEFTASSAASSVAGGALEDDLDECDLLQLGGGMDALPAPRLAYLQQPDSQKMVYSPPAE